MKQKDTEWLGNNIHNEPYHTGQWINIYRSTIMYCDWLEELGILASEAPLKICDMCAGGGANLHYMINRYPQHTFTGIEINYNLVEMGNKRMGQSGIKEPKLEVGDLYNIEHKHFSLYDGIIMYQTLSWLPDFRIPIKNLAEMNPQWIGLTSLFYDGDINVQIQIQDYSGLKDIDMYKSYDYNTYSLKLIKDLFSELGYNKFYYKSFDIDIDIPKNNRRDMGTYTEKLESGRRIQLSGPLLMNWYFVLASK